MGKNGLLAIKKDLKKIAASYSFSFGNIGKLTAEAEFYSETNSIVDSIIDIGNIEIKLGISEESRSAAALGEIGEITANKGYVIDKYNDVNKKIIDFLLKIGRAEIKEKLEIDGVPGALEQLGKSVVNIGFDVVSFKTLDALIDLRKYAFDDQNYSIHYSILNSLDSIFELAITKNSEDVIFKIIDLLKDAGNNAIKMGNFYDRILESLGKGRGIAQKNDLDNVVNSIDKSILEINYTKQDKKK